MRSCLECIGVGHTAFGQCGRCGASHSFLSTLSGIEKPLAVCGSLHGTQAQFYLLIFLEVFPVLLKPAQAPFQPVCITILVNCSVSERLHSGQTHFKRRRTACPNKKWYTSEHFSSSVLHHAFEAYRLTHILRLCALLLKSGWTRQETLLFSRKQTLCHLACRYPNPKVDLGK